MYASDYRRIARERLSGNWWLSVGVALVAALLGGAIYDVQIGINSSINIDAETLSHTPEYLIPVIMAITSTISALALAKFILGGPVSVGNARYLLDQQDGLTLQFKTLFSGFEQFGAAFLMKLLKGIFVALWMLLFIIPGIIAAYSYSMAAFIMAENPGITAREALRASKDLMYGHKWELFCLDFSFIGWSILCVFTLGIGSLFLAPYIAASHAAFYRSIATSRYSQ